jgi:tRNA threonylcarbamoyladenosine biosynthesis protein TsaB
MNILSIDTSGQLLSIALLKNDSLTEESYSSDKKHSENILPLLKKLMDKSDIAFGAGPGSFTGVRIAAGVAYGIAYAHNLSIVGINNLEAIAKKVDKVVVIPCVDARMGELYMGAYKRINGELVSIIDSGVFEPCDLPNLDILDGVIVGSGVFEYKKILIEKYRDQKVIIDENEYPLAGAIAQLSIKRMDKNFNLKNAAPIYIRNNVAKTISERKIDLKAKERKI